MSWLSKLLRRPPKKTTIAPTTDAFLPLYPQFGTNIYASDVVQQAVKCIVDEIKKLRPAHIRYVDNEPIPIKSSIQSVLDNPNPLMTTTEFLEKTIWMLMLNYNSFIIPIYDQKEYQNGEIERTYKALYPVKPIDVFFIQDASEELFVKFIFPNGYETTIKYSDVIHIRYSYSVSQYMGGDETGKPNNDALLKTLDLNHNLLDGVAKSMKASYAINGVVKYNTLLDDGKTEAALKELERKLKNNESGFLPLDMKADFTPLEHKSALVDGDTLKFIDEKILRHWGVPLSILTGDYTKEQYEAFYQKALEPIVISMSQAFTKKLFTEREKAFGNKIELYPKDLIFMTVSEILRTIELFSPTGTLLENEKRAMLGLAPLPELEGKRYMSLNWIDANSANQYQIGKVNVDVVDEEKEDI